MNRSLNILRSLFVSPELLICAIGTLVLNFLPEQLIWLSKRIGDQEGLLKYLGLLPVALVAYDAKTIKEILMPKSDKRTILQKWELYSDFKASCIVALIYAVLFGVAGIACLLFDWKTPTSLQAACLLTSVVGALTTSTSLYFANIRIEELFRQHSAHAP